VNVNGDHPREEGELSISTALRQKVEPTLLAPSRGVKLVREYRDHWDKPQEA
jgi:hypothetical protein